MKPALRTTLRTTLSLSPPLSLSLPLEHRSIGASSRNRNLRTRQQHSHIPTVPRSHQGKVQIACRVTFRQNLSSRGAFRGICISCRGRGPLVPWALMKIPNVLPAEAEAEAEAEAHRQLDARTQERRQRIETIVVDSFAIKYDWPSTSPLGSLYVQVNVKVDVDVGKRHRSASWATSSLDDGAKSWALCRSSRCRPASVLHLLGMCQFPILSRASYLRHSDSRGLIR